MRVVYGSVPTMSTIITREEALERGAKRYFTGVPCVKGHVSERNTSDNRCVECKRLKDANRKPLTEEQVAQRAEYHKNWYQANKERLDARVQTEEGHAIRLRADRKRRSDPARKQYHREYYSAENQKNKRREWENTRYAEQEIVREKKKANRERFKLEGLTKVWHAKHRATEKYREGVARRRSTPEYKLERVMRNSLARCLRGSFKTERTYEILGYWTDELYAHLEYRLSKEYPGVTIEQALQDGWHVDHIIPIAHWLAVAPTLGLSLGDLCRRANALANLHLIPAEENLKKGANLTQN